LAQVQFPKPIEAPLPRVAAMVRIVAFASAVCTNAMVLKENSQELTLNSEVSKLLDGVSTSLLNPALAATANLDSAMRAVEAHMDLTSAAKAVEHKSDLPNDVQHLVQKVSGGSDAGFSAEFSEESLAKARRALNGLVEKAWIELDDKIMECKGFEDMNRENYGQVTRDIARLIAQINDLERIEAESVDGIAAKEQEILDVEALLDQETSSYNAEYATNSAELTIRQNDLDVFQFILVFTKCEDATSFGQMKVCESRAGHRTIMFHDQQQNEKYRKMLTPAAKREINRLLHSFDGPSLLQRGSPPINSTASQPPPSKAKAEPVKDGASPEEASLACNPDMVPDCALLHDKLSLMWGEFKDKVDELTYEMMKNEFEFGELKTTLNSQITMLTNKKATLNQLLAEARANLANDNEELSQKYTQKAALDLQYVKFMAACKKRIDWIFYQDMCAIKIVRNAVMENSTVCPSADINDCQMGDWVPEECSVSCDDSCVPAEPYKCGGWQEMKREPVVPNDDCGIKCPRYSLYKRCGQYHCPINCDMSMWSGWSKCTAECGGGLQSHTRSILTKPHNGGLPCNTVEESRPCATWSCDRNCRLASWTSFTPCSVACDGGFNERYRHVAIPTRGKGKCPTGLSRFRYQKGSCNTHACKGDEICVANQDLVIAVDGSGSIRDTGFKILKTFVSKFLDRYETQYWGNDAVKLSIVLFGNGVIMPDGKSVSPAIIRQPLTFDMAAVKTAVNDLPFKKGFTNMAQAFAAAETAFTQGSRRGSQSSVLVITDGKPSFNFMTTQMVEQLDDKAVTRYFLVVSEESMDSDAMKVIKEWASQPWETNLVHVPGGLALLESDPNTFVARALVKFCPNAYSPSDAQWEEINYGYAHVMDGRYCGDRLDENLLGTVDDVEQCAALVSGAEGQSFIYGVSFAVGKCYKGTVDVGEAQFNSWLESKMAPECPEGIEKHTSTLFDFYAMEPVAAAEAAEGI
jgi:hypothetical protein